MITEGEDQEKKRIEEESNVIEQKREGKRSIEKSLLFCSSDDVKQNYLKEATSILCGGPTKNYLTLTHEQDLRWNNIKEMSPHRDDDGQLIT